MTDAFAATTRMGTVELTSTDAERLARFYEEVVGLQVLATDGDVIALGAPGGADALVRIVGDPDASRVRGVNGLFHLAVLLPDRADLGHAIRRVVDHGWRLTGASDHVVSEALYLRDPEGNGIEIYRDRPREDWRWSGGEVDMGTVALDLQPIVDAAAGEPVTRARVSPQAVIGHVHLSVGSLQDVVPFYSDVIGLDVTAHYGDQATFLSAGGYHHHLGMNTWAGHGLLAPPPDVTGLRSFEIVSPDALVRQTLHERAVQAGAVLAEDDGVTVLRDPAGLLVHIRP